MVNRKAIMRILEATVAIMIVFAVVIIVVERKAFQTETDLTPVITPLLEEIAKDNVLREIIVADNDSLNSAEIEIMGKFLPSRIKSPNLGYKVTICDFDKVCSLQEYPGDVKGSVFAGTRIISTTLTQNASKKLTIYIWQKG